LVTGLPNDGEVVKSAERLIAARSVSCPCRADTREAAGLLKLEGIRESRQDRPLAGK